MQRSQLIAAASIVVTALALSTLFFFNSNAPATEKPPALPPLRIDTDRSTPAEDVRDIAETASAILSRIEGDDSLEGLSPDQIESLAQRSAEVIVVRCQGSVDDLITLLETWGGTLNIPVDGPDYQRMERSWLSPGHPNAIARIGLSETSVARIEPTPGVARISPRKGVSTSTMMTSAPVDFAGNRVELMKSGADQVEVFFPVVTNSGDNRQVGIRMIWSEPDRNWIPLVFIQYVEPGTAMPSSIF